MKKTARIFSLIAAMCFFIYAIFNLIYLGHRLKFTTLLYYIGIVSSTAAMSVTLVIKNKKAVMVAAIISAILPFIHLLAYLISYSSFLLSDIFDVLAYVGVIVLIVLSLKRNKIVKKIWFVPAATMFLFEIPTVISIISVLATGYRLSRLIILVSAIVALLFVGLWLKEDTVIISSIIDEADKLKMYNELLKSGKITQEEFDKKKKKILGLSQDQPSQTVHQYVNAPENMAMTAQKQRSANDSTGANNQETRKGDFWICSGCGTTNDNSGAFCSNCGKGK